jgi:hypothetical protein
LLIEKFVPKPQFEFEAVEFTGGIDNGRDLMVWIIEQGGLAEWRDEDPGEWNRCGMREHVRIYIGGMTMFAYVGDYVILDEVGDFKTFRRANFISRFSKVVSADVVSIPTLEMVRAIA